MRVTDITDADRPREVGHFLPPAPPGEAAPESTTSMSIGTN
jgi:hypothetical protein